MSFSRGGSTLQVPVELFLENRRRLIEATRAAAPPSSVIVLRGGVEKGRYNTDADDLPLRQESYFFWAFGIHESDCYVAIDVDSGQSVLFPPKLAPDYAIWLGKIEPESWFKDKYKFDEVLFHEKDVIANRLRKFSPKQLLVLRAANTDSGNYLEPATFEGIDQFTVDTILLYPLMAELRVLKTDHELAVLRYASKCANEAHKEVMRHIRPNMYEYQLESLFRHISYYTGGCRHMSYTCIAASGLNGAILHYGHANAPNAKLIKDGDMCLFDMGPEYNCYASDVTCSFPANGKFTEKQKMIYNAVLRANLAVFKAAKPGVWWTDMHILAERVILEDLKTAGLVQGDVEAMLDARLGAVFMPSGLGHFMGLDVHDCGGYLGDALERSKLPGLKSLRTTRTLKERMVITIEPGCYFIDTLLDAAIKDSVLSKFLVVDKINEYRGHGGVRIEDDVVIWASDNENMNADLPRTVDQIEAFMADTRRSTATSGRTQSTSQRFYLNFAEWCHSLFDGKRNESIRDNSLFVLKHRAQHGNLKRFCTRVRASIRRITKCVRKID